MDDRNLTNYDRYLLAKKREESERENADRENSEYDKYLIKELRRTGPSDRPVMSEGEYFAMQNGGAARKNNSSNSDEEKKGGKSRILPPFRKYGKIILVVYVILMLALASILIATNINSAGLASSENAGAMSDIAKSGTPDGSIRPMSIEEDDETEESNWFDKLCDSLNK